MAQGEVPVPGKPHHQPDHHHQQGDWVGQGNQADKTDEHEDDAGYPQNHTAEEPEADYREDRDAEYREDHLASSSPGACNSPGVDAPRFSYTRER
ncbi:MAG TPA: hypothetical protein VLK89_04465 [Solirubrobacterales bacterium]|nr:hypothetical protein [Solirubrobacterales bacterium]